MIYVGRNDGKEVCQEVTLASGDTLYFVLPSKFTTIKSAEKFIEWIKIHFDEAGVLRGDYYIDVPEEVYEHKYFAIQ